VTLKKNKRSASVSPSTTASATLEDVKLVSPAAKKARKEESPPSSVKEWRDKNKIVVMDARDTDEGKEETKRLNEDASYNPFMSFEDPACKELIAAPLLRQCTEGNGFTKPSPIQAQSWPILMQTHNGRNRDVVGIAETGSGKTLAFAIPALSQMLKDKKQKRRAPRMLVLAPTRELAMQSDVVLQEFGAVAGLRSLVLYGGVPKHTQVAELRKKDVDCVVATPGRIKDLINDGACDLSEIQYLVLDEAGKLYLKVLFILICLYHMVYGSIL
jgi:ATP-dependent RNA helicase DBP3